MKQPGGQEAQESTRASRLTALQIPRPLYERVKAIAERERRSPTQQVMVFLELCCNGDDESRGRPA